MEKAFEDCMMPLPVGYDAYLRTVFGRLHGTAAGKRPVAHHDCVFLDLHEPYTKYRGIYYLTKEAEDGNKRVTK